MRNPLASKETSRKIGYGIAASLAVVGLVSCSPASATEPKQPSPQELMAPCTNLSGTRLEVTTQDGTPKVTCLSKSYLKFRQEAEGDDGGTLVGLCQARYDELKKPRGTCVIRVTGASQNEVRGSVGYLQMSRDTYNVKGN